MRLTPALAAVALLAASLAAHADSLTDEFTGNGVTTDFSGFPGLLTSPFQRFDPSIGTLNSLVISVRGTAMGSDFNALNEVRDGGDTFELLNGTGSGFGSFSFSAQGTVTNGSALSSFYGSGLTSLLLFFNGTDTHITTTDTTGSITYNYTPATLPVATTPEPYSLALLGTGLLGALGAFRKRYL